MTEQVSNPLGVTHIRLASRHRLDVLRVDDEDSEEPLAKVLDRATVSAAALQRHMRAPRRLQPVDQAQEVVRHRPEGADFLLRPAASARDEQARHDRALVHIEPTTPRIHDFHRLSLPARGAGLWYQRYCSACF